MTVRLLALPTLAEVLVEPLGGEIIPRSLQVVTFNQARTSRRLSEPVHRERGR
jgi:hypothetical protein